MTDPRPVHGRDEVPDKTAAGHAADSDLDSFRDDALRIEAEIARAVLGQNQVVREVLIAILAGGHILIEGVPGVGKTLLVRSFATTLGFRLARVQCTPDLIPADITGTNILVEDEAHARHFRFQPGPIFSEMLLADEINRATPKTQSAFLEAMQERQVTVGGVSHPLPVPFVLLATQNPIEMEGTFPLPEAQVDRFMYKIMIEYPDQEHLREIALKTTGTEPLKVAAVVNPGRVTAMQRFARRIPVAADFIDAAVRVVRATHPANPEAPEPVRRFVRFGASPRAVQAIILGAKVHALLTGRYHVSNADLAAALRPSLRHRILLTFEAATSSFGAEQLFPELEQRLLR